MRDNRELLFGYDSAEKDNYLDTYFIQTGSYRDVANHRKLIIIGRKGSGKSAIFKCLNSDDNVLYIKLSPNKFSSDYINPFHNIVTGTNYAGQLASTALWKYLILSQITDILKHKKNDTHANTIIQDSFGIMDSWIKSNVDFNSLQNFVNDNGNINMLQPNEKQKIDLEFIHQVLSRKAIHVLIDDLDFIWDNSSWTQTFFRGLIECAFDMSGKQNLYITLFIRDDIFSVIQRNYHRIDNMRELIEELTWSPSLLKQMIGKRIQTYYNLPSTRNQEDYWYSILPKAVHNYDSFKYMIERTQLRPREIIQFCQLSFDIATQYKKNRIDERDIQQAEPTYSDWKLDDLNSEYASVYNNLTSLFNAFSGVSWEMPRKNLLETIDSVLQRGEVTRVDETDTRVITESEILQFLYDIGFIRAKVLDPHYNREKFRGSSTYKRLNLGIVNTFDIHPAYRKAMFNRS